MTLKKTRSWFEALIARAEGVPVDVRATVPAEHELHVSPNAGFPSFVPGVVHGAFGKFIQMMRRKNRLSPEQLAERANVDLPELLQVEEDSGAIPSTRTVVLLAQFFGVPVKALLQLSGHATVDSSSPIAKAAVRFAASSKSMDKLSAEEREALNEFVRALEGP